MNLARVPTAATYLRLIMDDDTNRREPTDTDVVPAMSQADREAETSPLASDRPMRRTDPPGPADFEAERVLKTMLPSAPRAPTIEQDTDDMTAMATDELVVLHRKVSAGLDELLNPGGRLERQTATVAAIVDQAMNRLEGNYNLIAGQLRSLSEATAAKDREQDRRFEGIERKQNDLRDSVSRQMSDLRGRIELIERSVEQGRVTENQIGELKSLINNLVLKFDAIETTPMPRALKANRPLVGRVVLVVEDVAALLRSQIRALESSGATVLAAQDFDEAKVAVANARPDCALLDLRLGHASGFDVADWLIAEKQLAPERILLLTGQAEHRDREAAERLSLTVLEKPIGSAELVDAILLSLARPIP